MGREMVSFQRDGGSETPPSPPGRLFQTLLLKKKSRDLCPGLKLSQISERIPPSRSFPAAFAVDRCRTSSRVFSKYPWDLFWGANTSPGLGRAAGGPGPAPCPSWKALAAAGVIACRLGRTGGARVLESIEISPVGWE